MSEKRFIISKNTSERSTTGIIDVERQTHLWVKEVVELLNEQQAILIKQEQKIKHLREVLTEIYVMSVQESIISEERSENDE